MTLTLVGKDSSTRPAADNLVTVQELAVAREYYKYVHIDLNFVCTMNTIVACGKGYTREVEDPEVLAKIRAADILKVRGIK